MAATLLQIMQGIETRLNTVTKLRATDTAPDFTDPVTTGGFAIVGVPPFDYRTTFGRAKYQIDFTITVLTSAAVSRVGQALLAGFADPTGAGSVVVAIEADPTLGGIVDTCWLTTFRPLGLEEVGVIGYYGGLFSGHIAARGV